MSHNEHPIPTEIKLHSKSRLLSIGFDDGCQFELPCEYLRVFSPAAEVKALGQPLTGKESVNIERIEPQGHYAIRLIFDDGHDTGIYAWETLYALGKNQEKNWTDYLKQLKTIGYQREIEESGEKRSLHILYFAYLAQKLRREAEDIQVPAAIKDVQSLTQWLRNKWRDKGYLLADDRITLTVNRQFAEPFTKLESGDEIAITPNSPNPPPPPQ